MKICSIYDSRKVYIRKYGMIISEVLDRDTIINCIDLDEFIK